MSNREREFRQLLEELKDGSEEAARRIVDKYSPNIYRVVRRKLPRIVRRKLDSADIVQSVWLSLLNNADRLAEAEDPHSFMTYLAGMARNKVLERYHEYTYLKNDIRREKPILALDQPNACRDSLGGPTASARFSAQEMMNRTLANCGEREEKIVEMRMEGRDNGEIAATIKTSPRTVRRILNRLRGLVMS